jgi:dynein heavy chain
LREIAAHIDDPDPSYETVGREKGAEERLLEDMIMPEKWRFPIKSTFRLFISTLPTEDFPPGFARKCTKMALELPTTVQRISRKNLESVPPDKFKYINGNDPYKDEYRKILMSLSILHAVVSRRDQFGPFGWSKPGYEFSPNDFEIAVAQLIDLCKGMKAQVPNQRMPVLLMRHMVTYLNYGSVVTNQQDLGSLSEIVNSFINAEMFNIPHGET